MIEFLDQDHLQRFAAVWGQLNEFQRRQADWVSCLYLLTADKWHWQRIAQHVRCDKGEIAWSKIHKLPLGNGETILMQVANALFNGGGRLDFSGIFDSLDGANFNLVMRAMRVRRGGFDCLKLTA